MSPRCRANVGWTWWNCTDGKDLLCCCVWRRVWSIHDIRIHFRSFMLIYVLTCTCKVPWRHNLGTCLFTQLWIVPALLYTLFLKELVQSPKRQECYLFIVYMFIHKRIFYPNSTMRSSRYRYCKQHNFSKVSCPRKLWGKKKHCRKGGIVSMFVLAINIRSNGALWCNSSVIKKAFVWLVHTEMARSDTPVAGIWTWGAAVGIIKAKRQQTNRSSSSVSFQSRSYMASEAAFVG